ncbi:MAG: type VI secretion system baseplate subunit TssG [Pseudomonadota bacterium]|nr:type VI secretion system baseplate subunit TssG [Pseudomonadota bacterium]
MNSPAPTTRTPLDPMAPAIQRLHQEPWNFGFFQAVKLIYSAHGFDGRGSGSRPGPLRFTAPSTLGFPCSEVSAISQADTTLKMQVNFMGLTGPSGVLPHSYSEWLTSRGRDRGAADFFDIFNHRLLSLFWQAWAKYRPEIGQQFGYNNSVLRYLEPVIGMGTPALTARLHPRATGAKANHQLPGAAMIYFSGLVSQRPHGERAIAQVVSALVDAPVRSQGCLGTWQQAPAGEQTRLAHSGHRLGQGCLLGPRYWDRQTTLRLTVGPLDQARYHALLPRGERLHDIVELTRFLTGLGVDLRIRLSLRGDQIPALQLGLRDANPAQLGWNTWLAGRRKPAPAEDCEFHFSALGDQSWH